MSWLKRHIEILNAKYKLDHERFIDEITSINNSFMSCVTEYSMQDINKNDSKNNFNMTLNLTTEDLVNLVYSQQWVPEEKHGITYGLGYPVAGGRFIWDKKLLRLMKEEKLWELYCQLTDRK